MSRKEVCDHFGFGFLFGFFGYFLFFLNKTNIMKKISKDRKERNEKDKSRQWKGKMSPPAITLCLCSFDVRGQTDGFTFDSWGWGHVQQSSVGYRHSGLHGNAPEGFCTVWHNPVEMSWSSIQRSLLVCGPM